MMPVVRCGTTISPSEGLFKRLTTMLFSRLLIVTMTPAVGETGTSTPAILATFSAHGPVALMTRSAPSVSVFPVRWSSIFTPVTLRPERVRSVTSV